MTFSFVALLVAVIGSIAVGVFAYMVLAFIAGRRVHGDD